MAEKHERKGGGVKEEAVGVGGGGSEIIKKKNGQVWGGRYRWVLPRAVVDFRLGMQANTQGTCSKLLCGTCKKKRERNVGSQIYIGLHLSRLGGFGNCRGQGGWERGHQDYVLPIWGIT